LNKLWEEAVNRYSDRKCLGYRPLLRIHRIKKTLPNGVEKVWETPEFAGEKWFTYKEVDQRVVNYARGLVQFCGLNSGDRFAVFENTCMEWLMSAHAAYKYNITLVTVYANLGEEALVHSLNETKVTALLTNEDQLPRFVSLSKQIPSLRNVIYVPCGAIESTDEERQKRANVIKQLQQETDLSVLSFTEVEKLGAEQGENYIRPRSIPDKDDLCMVMYTSGTTGIPKGVQIRHRNLVASVAGVGEGLELEPGPDQSYIGFLPLAHILETTAELYMLTAGSRIGYGNPRTLTDTGAKPYGDFTAFKPTLICVVPRILDTIKKTILGKLEEQSSGSLKKWLFNSGFAAKKAAFEAGRDTPLWNLVLFNKLSALMGGRAELILSGGAPLSAETHEFVRICFNSSVVQGYGLTETCAGLSVQSQFDKMRPSSVGAPIPSAEVKLVSIPEMNYMSTDPKPRGEVWTRGPCVSAGYFGTESEDFDDDGWFHTGDVAELQDDNSLKIIDRKKNLVKLDHGEYVALEKVESVYSTSRFVAPNGICIYGDSQRSYVVGLVLPEPLNAKNWAAEHGVADDIAELCKNKDFIKAVKESFDAEAKKGKLKNIELLGGFVLLPDEWTVENEALTAAMKLKRNVLADRYKQHLDNLYNQK
jgi:long-chain acyl-CoA synthetase